MRRAAKVDANQAKIVAALRQMGCTVQPLHAVGEGVPDLLCGFRGINILIEVKDGAKPPSQRSLTDAQVEWHGGWKGQVAVAKDEHEAVAIVIVTAAKHAGWVKE
jgi:hypothetical protein